MLGRSFVIEESSDSWSEGGAEPEQGLKIVPVGPTLIRKDEEDV